MDREKLILFLENRLKGGRPFLVGENGHISTENLHSMEIDHLRVAYRKAYEEMNSLLEEAIPFVSPVYDADFTFWSALPAWSCSEFATLAVGKDPRKINKQDLQAISAISEIGAQYEKAYQWACRFRILHKTPRLKSPDEFIEDAQTAGFSLPAALISAVRESLGNKFSAVEKGRPLETNVNLLDGDKPLDPKSRRSIYIMLLGITRKKYKFRDNLQRDGIYKRIAGDINDIFQGTKASISEETVRFHIRAAKENIEQWASVELPDIES